MQLEQLAPSLELCERLKELGYPQHESLFYWIKEVGSDKWTLCYRENLDVEIWLADDIAVAAPTMSEVFYYIPINIKPIDSQTSWFFFSKDGLGYHAFFDDHIDEPSCMAIDANPVNAIVFCAIKLIKQGHVSFKNV